MDGGSGGLSPFDILVGGAVIASGIVAFTRGFVTEILSLAAWLGALLIALYGSPLVTGIARSIVSPAELSDVITLVVVFFGSLLLLRLGATMLGDQIRASNVGALDRALGALFGLMRGALIVSAIYFVISYVVPERRQPDWVREARLQPLISLGSKMVAAIGPALFEAGAGDKEDIFDRLSRQAGKTSAPKDARQAAETAYKDAQRALLDQAVKSALEKDDEKASERD